MSKPRYVRKDARVSAGSSCRLCGTAWGGYPTRECPVTICKACDTPQCLGNGLGHGACGICHVGLLPGWSGSDLECGYKGCTNRAVAFAPRVGTCCAEHALRARTSPKKITIAEYIVEQLVLCGKNWELRSQIDASGGIAMVAPVLILLFFAGCDGTASAVAVDGRVGDAGTFEAAADSGDGNTVSRSDRPAGEVGPEVGVEVGPETGIEAGLEVAPDALSDSPSWAACTPAATCNPFVSASSSGCPAGQGCQMYGSPTCMPQGNKTIGEACAQGTAGMECGDGLGCVGYPGGPGPVCRPLCCLASGGSCPAGTGSCGSVWAGAGACWDMADAGSDAGTAVDTLPEVEPDATPIGCRGTATCGPGLSCPAGVVCTVNMLRCTCESGTFSCTCM